MNKTGTVSKNFGSNPTFEQSSIKNFNFKENLMIQGLGKEKCYPGIKSRNEIKIDVKSPELSGSQITSVT